MKKWLSCLFAVVLLLCLTACNPNSAVSDDSSDATTTTTTQQNSNATNYISYDTEQSEEYNNAIGIYNSFLNGLIPYQGDAAFFITDCVRGSNGKSGIDSYALADVNQDNIPELFIHAMSKEVLGVVDGKLTCWYSSGGSVKVSLLENGALFTSALNSPDYHTYITFDKQGAKNEIWFAKGATGPTAPTNYTFNGDDVTKEEWEALTAPYFAQAEKTVELQWSEWNESE